jgi:hypothetical protein
MKVRAVTGFLDPGWPVEAKDLKNVADALKAARAALREAGYEVQSLRLATPPPAEMENPVPPNERQEFARQLEAEIFALGVDYLALGPVLPGDVAGFEALPKILEGTEAVFCSALFADHSLGLSLQAARAAAGVILAASALQADGFANLRFAALANVAPGSPFFPAAYHRGGQPALALATEAADLAVSAVRGAKSPQSLARLLQETIEGHAGVLARVGQSVAADFDLRFLGIDFSLAPYPEAQRSLGTALEAFGTQALGLAGSFAAAAFLADTLGRAQYPKVGFNGLFFPVLEDAVLAERAAQGKLQLTDLLLLSTLCGTGLDTVPLPGDISQGQIAAILLDLGAIALRHNKPLTARLMPIPGRKAGDPVRFDFPYFADSAVLDPRAGSVSGLLEGGGLLDIAPPAPE